MALSDWKIIHSNGANEYIYSNGQHHIGVTSEIVQVGKKLQRHWKATHLESKKELGMGRSRGIAIGTAVDALEGDMKKSDWNADMTEAYSTGLNHGKAGEKSQADKYGFNQAGMWGFKAAYEQGHAHGSAQRHKEELMNKPEPKPTSTITFSTMKSENAPKWNRGDVVKLVIAPETWRTGQHPLNGKLATYQHPSPEIRGEDGALVDKGRHKVRLISDGTDHHVYAHSIVKKSESTMDNLKKAVVTAILKKAQAWLMRTTETRSVVVDSGVDKAAAELNKAEAPKDLDWEEVQKSEENALTKWEPSPFVDLSEELQKSGSRSNDKLAARIFDQHVKGRNLMTPHRVGVTFSPDGNHVVEISHGTGFANDKIYGAAVVESKGYDADNKSLGWQHSHEKSKSFNSMADVHAHIASLGEKK